MANEKNLIVVSLVLFVSFVGCNGGAGSRNGTTKIKGYTIPFDNYGLAGVAAIEFSGDSLWKSDIRDDHTIEQWIHKRKSIDAKDKDGYTLLFGAAYHGRDKFVSLLLQWKGKMATIETPQTHQ